MVTAAKTGQRSLHSPVWNIFYELYLASDDRDLSECSIIPTLLWNTINTTRKITMSSLINCLTIGLCLFFLAQTWSICSRKKAKSSIWQPCNKLAGQTTVMFAVTTTILKLECRQLLWKYSLVSPDRPLGNWLQASDSYSSPAFRNFLARILLFLLRGDTSQTI